MGRMAPSLSAPPTAREIALLLVLLTFLLVTTSNFTSSLESNQLGNYPFLQSPPKTSHNSTHTNDTAGPRRFETVSSWKGSEKVPDTVVVAHVPGWTIFDRLYALNGTLYVVTDDPASVPDRNFVISTALKIANGPIEAAKRIPTDKELRVISTAHAKTLFGSGADVMDGVTVWLVILARSVAPSLTCYESGMPTTQANCKVHSTHCRTNFPNAIDLASPIITIGLLNSFSDSGEHTPHLTHLSRKTETRLCPHRAECCSHTSTLTIGGIMPK